MIQTDTQTTFWPAYMNSLYGLSWAKNQTNVKNTGALKVRDDKKLMNIAVEGS